MASWKKEVFIYIDPKQLEAQQCEMQGHVEKHQVWSGGRESEGRIGSRALVMVSPGRNE